MTITNPESIPQGFHFCQREHEAALDSQERSPYPDCRSCPSLRLKRCSSHIPGSGILVPALLLTGKSSWHFPSLHFACSNCATCPALVQALGGKINDGEAIDPPRGTWSARAPMKQSHGEPGSGDPHRQAPSPKEAIQDGQALNWAETGKTSRSGSRGGNGGWPQRGQRVGPWNQLMVPLSTLHTCYSCSPTSGAPLSPRTDPSFRPRSPGPTTHGQAGLATPGLAGMGSALHSHHPREHHGAHPHPALPPTGLRGEPQARVLYILCNAKPGVLSLPLTGAADLLAEWGL